MIFLFCYLALMNLAAFAAFGADKRRARERRWRVPEETLLLLAAFGGSLGALTGMLLFHHKTKHRKFRFGVPVLLAAQLAVLYWLCG